MLKKIKGLYILGFLKKITLTMALTPFISLSILASDITISKKELDYALMFHEQHGDKLDIELFNSHTKSYQSVLLGSILILKNQSKVDLGIRLLKSAISHSGDLNTFSLGYTLDLLGATYQKKGDIVNAEKYFKKAIQTGYEESCNNLGVMYEKNKEFKKARKTYLDCIPKLATPLLYMNLGTLYYNGLGVDKDYKKGSSYWYKSYDLFRYDPDVNYNLGIYHLNYTKKNTLARYFFIQASLLGDSESKHLLQSPPMRSEYAGIIFSYELLFNEINREREIRDRLYYFIEKNSDYFSSVQLNIYDNGTRIVARTRVSTNQVIKDITTGLFKIIYGDISGESKIEIKKSIEGLMKKGEYSLNLHGWDHYLKINNGVFDYLIISGRIL